MATMTKPSRFGIHLNPLMNTHLFILFLSLMFESYHLWIPIIRKPLSSSIKALTQIAYPKNKDEESLIAHH